MNTMTRLEKVVMVLGITFASPVAQALVNFNADTLAHPSQWVVGLVVGCVTSLGLQLRVWRAKQGL